MEHLLKRVDPFLPHEKAELRESPQGTPIHDMTKGPALIRSGLP